MMKERMEDRQCQRCGQPVAEGATLCRKCLPWPLRWRRELTLLAALVGLSIVLFAGAWFLSRSFEAQRASLADQWFETGQQDLQDSKPQEAVAAFRSALFYRDSDAYRFRLAEALLAANHREQAKAYLLNLWEERPGSSNINLALARIAAQQNQTTEAIRYYQSAIYGVWDSDALQHRTQTRVEFIHYLLGINQPQRAYAEITSLAASIPAGDADPHMLAGQLFAQSGDIGSALTQFEASLKINPNLFPALAGAAKAAFAAGEFQVAKRYLDRALRQQPSNAELSQMLKQTNLVLSSDPFERHLPQSARVQRAFNAFKQAGLRLQQCGAMPADTTAQSQRAAQKSPASSTKAGPTDSTANAPQSTPDLTELAASWNELKPNMTSRSMARNPDLIDTAMDLVSRIEQGAATSCGPPTGLDWALLQLSNHVPERER